MNEKLDKFGKQKSKEQDYEAAIQAYNKALTINPNDLETYESRAIAYFFKENYKKAIEDINKAIELNRNRVESYQTRGWFF